MKKSKQHIKNAHDLEHVQWSRRSFLQTLGIGGVGSMFLGGNYISAAAMQPMMAALNGVDNDRVLVLIRFAGGNDGLNTIVPMNYYDVYAQNRPTLYHRENELISLSNEFAMPDFMSSLEPMWGDGKMKVVHGMGYDNQSSSHFAGNDIYATANVDRVEELETRGWLGNYFNNEYDDFLTNPPEKPLAIQIGSSSNLLFNYDELQYAYLVANPGQLEDIAQTGLQFSLNNVDTACKSGEQLQFLRASANNTFKYAEAIHDAYIDSTNVAEYDDNSLADQLSLVARMVKGNLGTKIYMVSISGFDTHSDQGGTHQDLLTKVSESVSAFYQDLAATGHDQNVLSMTFSEFGRRVDENGSRGTDHGKAAPSLLFGPALNGNGFAGLHPDLENDITARGDVEYTTDFRRLYGTVLSQWLCADNTDVEVSLNGIFENLDLGFECSVDNSVTEEEEPIEEEEEVIVVVPPVEEEEEITEMVEEETETVVEEEEMPEAVDEENTDNDEDTMDPVEEETTETVDENEEMTETIDEENTEIDTETEVEEVAEIEEETTLGTTDTEILEEFSYTTYNMRDQTFVKINNEQSRQIKITLYAMTGQEVGVVTNKNYTEGSHTINVKDGIKTYLNPGTYICRIMSDDIYNKRIMIY